MIDSFYGSTVCLAFNDWEQRTHAESCDVPFESTADDMLCVRFGHPNFHSAQEWNDALRDSTRVAPVIRNVDDPAVLQNHLCSGLLRMYAPILARQDIPCCNKDDHQVPEGTIGSGSLQSERISLLGKGYGHQRSDVLVVEKT